MIQFINDHAVATVIITFLLLNFLAGLWKIFFRQMSIRKHGWPPAHIDADGDPIKVEKS